MLKPPVTLVTGHAFSNIVGQAFARGCGGEVRIVQEAPRNGLVAFYGLLRGTGDVVRQRWRQEQSFLYLDHGYIRLGHFHGHYRVCRNDLHSYLGEEPDHGRLLSLGWLPEERHRSLAYSPVLVAAPSPHIARFFGFEVEAWLAQVHREIRAVSERPIIVSSKDDHPALPLLEKSYAVVTLQSNIAIEAIRRAIPVFIARGNLPSRWWHPAQVWNTDLSRIEEPYMPTVEERRHWAAQLAACQFTLQEMHSGYCWTRLNRNPSSGDSDGSNRMDQD